MSGFKSLITNLFVQKNENDNENSILENELGSEYNEDQVDFEENYEEEAEERVHRKAYVPAHVSENSSDNNDEDEDDYSSVIVSPQSFEDAKNIVKNIKRNKMITLNLESLNPDVMQRILDYLAGAMNITGATFAPISKKIFTIVPASTKIQYSGLNSRNAKPLSIIDIEREDK